MAAALVEIPDSPIENDVSVQYDNASGFSETRYYNGVDFNQLSSWIVVDQLVGNEPTKFNGVDWKWSGVNSFTRGGSIVKDAPWVTGTLQHLEATPGTQNQKESLNLIPNTNYFLSKSALERVKTRCTVSPGTGGTGATGIAYVSVGSSAPVADYSTAASLNFNTFGDPSVGVVIDDSNVRVVETDGTSGSILTTIVPSITSTTPLEVMFDSAVSPINGTATEITVTVHVLDSSRKIVSTHSYVVDGSNLPSFLQPTWIGRGVSGASTGSDTTRSESWGLLYQLDSFE